MRFGEKDGEQDKGKNIWIEHLNIDTENWFQVFSACLGKMIAIQTACSEQVVKKQDWNVDFSEGIILFWKSKNIRFNLSEVRRYQAIHGCGGWENINGFSENNYSGGHAHKSNGGTLEFKTINNSRIYIG